MHELRDLKVAVIGLGYVGLPLALEFARHQPLIGFDIQTKRVDDLLQGRVAHEEIGLNEKGIPDNLLLTSNPNDLKSCNCYIVCVPTPVDNSNNPDLSALESASRTVGRYLRDDDIVIYESTVYPGVTEGFCADILAKNLVLVSLQHLLARLRLFSPRVQSRKG